MSQKVTRLFKQFKPENYQLLISPNKESMSFTGKVSIKGKKVGRPSQRLTFHQRNMKITGATIVKHDKKGDFEVKLSRINLHDKFNEVRLHSDTMFYPGNYTVNLEFEANITRPMNGIYPSFFSQGGVNKVLIATQFESHSAREAFPCIDEPESKATFDLTLSSPKDEVVIANSPVKSELVESESKLTSFETTPIMSTYLLAFVIGDIAFKEAKTKDGVLVRAYATPDNVNFTDFALKTAVKYLEFYNK
jgi:aminopeptidase N